MYIYRFLCLFTFLGFPIFLQAEADTEILDKLKKENFELQQYVNYLQKQLEHQEKNLNNIIQSQKSELEKEKNDVTRLNLILKKQEQKLSELKQKHAEETLKNYNLLSSSLACQTQLEESNADMTRLHSLTRMLEAQIESLEQKMEKDKTECQEKIEAEAQRMYRVDVDLSPQTQHLANQLKLDKRLLKLCEASKRYTAQSYAVRPLEAALYSYPNLSFSIQSTLYQNQKVYPLLQPNNQEIIQDTNDGRAWQCVYHLTSDTNGWIDVNILH